MKYGVAVVSPRVAIRSVCVFQSHPVGGVSFVIYNFLSLLFLFLWALHRDIPPRLGLKKDMRAEPAARMTRSGVVKGTCPA